MSSKEINNQFGNDISGLIFEYLSGEDYDDIYTAKEFIKTDSQLFLFEKDVEWNDVDINDICLKGWVELAKQKKFKFTTIDLVNSLKSGNEELIDHVLTDVEPNRFCLVSCIACKPQFFKRIWEKSNKSETKRISCVNECIKHNNIVIFKELYKGPTDIVFQSLKIACIERHDDMINLIISDENILKHIGDSCWNFLAYLIQNSYYDIAMDLIKTTPSLITIKCINEACISGNDKVLKLCLEKEPDYVDYAYYGADIACSNGNLNMIKILDEYGYLFSEDSINGAVEFGHYNIAKFLYDIHRVEPAEFAISEAVMKGYLDIIKWLYKEKLLNVIDINEVMLLACSNNKLSIVKWLEDKIDPTQTCMDCACESNAMDVAKHLYEKYNMFCTDTSFDVTASEGHIEMIEWLTSIGNKATSNAVDSCSGTNEFNGLKWLNENRGERGTERALENAVKRGNIEMTKYLLHHNYPPCSSNVLKEVMLYYNNSSIKECVVLVLNKYPELFTVNMLTRCCSYSMIKRIIKFCVRDELTPKILYKIVLNGVKYSRLKLIKMFINQVANYLEPEDMLELLNQAEENHIKKYLEMRLLNLPIKIDYLLDRISHINSQMNTNLSHLKSYWSDELVLDLDIMEHTKSLIYSVIDYVNEENINKYGSMCYLIALQGSNKTCSNPIKFSIEVTKVLDNLEVKPEEELIKDFDVEEYGTTIKKILKKISYKYPFMIC